MTDITVAVLIEVDHAAYAAGTMALKHFAERHPSFIADLEAVIGQGRGFDIVRSFTDRDTILLRVQPSFALRRVVRAAGGHRAVLALLRAYGCDLGLRVVV